jgi:transposase
MLCESNVMMYLEDWFDETDVFFTERMDGQCCSSLFASISYDERMRFFTEWVKHRCEQEYIVYDVTSISTYSLGIDIAEWGYNRDGEKIPQVNLGMYYGTVSRLPVYYNLYSGSVADKSHLVFMMTDAKKLGINNVRFVLDRGFVTEDNLVYMKNEGYAFITAFPGSRLEAVRLMDTEKGNVRKASQRIVEYETYGLRAPMELYGIQISAHIYYDPEKQVLDEKELYARIDRLRADLEKMSRAKRATKKYTDFFTIKQGKTNGMSFLPDNDKIDEKLSSAGFFILVSSETELSSSKVLSIYKGRDAIEKNFDELKNGLDFKRLRTHMNSTTDGKVFVGFLALILRSYLSGKIKDEPETKSLTIKKVLLELRKIKTVTFSDFSRSIMPLTKLQKLILDALGLTQKDLQGGRTK